MRQLQQCKSHCSPSCMQQSGAHLNSHDIQVTEEHVPAQLKKLPQNLELEGRDCMVLACVGLRGIDLHGTCNLGLVAQAV